MLLIFRGGYARNSGGGFVPGNALSHALGSGAERAGETGTFGWHQPGKFSLRVARRVVKHDLEIRNRILRVIDAHSAARRRVYFFFYL
jgi:hypothetical protein